MMTLKRGSYKLTQGENTLSQRYAVELAQSFRTAFRAELFR